MKKLIFSLSLAVSSISFAQIQSPALSPLAKVEQTVGLTKLTIEYSRPQKNNRAIFPSVIPYGQVWRAGANKNTLLTTDNKLIFGKDTLNAGTYSLFVRPEASEWTLIFYKTTNNWGVPENFNTENVVLEVKSKITKNLKPVENFTIAVDNITIHNAILSLAWDNITTNFPFNVNTDQQMKANIEAMFAGPSAADYHKAADYLLNSNGDMTAALEYITKAIEMSGGEKAPFFFHRKKALIQANLKDYKSAVETAMVSLEQAKKAGNDEYVRMNEASIKEWGKLASPDKKKLFGK